MTVAYLRDTAIQAGLKTDADRRRRTSAGTPAGGPSPTSASGRSRSCFKLYPWEWMLREPFGRHLPEAPTRWLEPPWKMILSNKAILPILCELFPDSPYLLRAEFEPFGDTYVVKPIHSREGANVTIVEDGRIVAETAGDYGDGPRIYQEYHPLPDFGGRLAGRRELDGQRPRLRDRASARTTGRSPGTPAGSSRTSSASRTDVKPPTPGRRSGGSGQRPRLG